MDPRWLVEVGMIGSGVAYAVAALGWMLDGKPWFALTFALYVGTAFTLYMGGKT